MHDKNIIVNLAIQSLIKEASMAPKPGLVDPLDNGSHSDMDYIMFLNSSIALKTGFMAYYDAGEKHEGSNKELFAKIRLIGMDNEQSMYASTANVNTHKGANFIYGIIIAIIGLKARPSLSEIRFIMMDMTQGLVEAELASLREYKTHGEKVYQEYGYTGIRGQVEAGLPLIFEHTLKIMKEDKDYNTNLKLALLYLIQHNDDSNMLKRGGIEGLNYGKELAAKAYTNLDQHLDYMNEEFKKYYLSPGGSADLLAITIFLDLYNDFIND